MSEERKKPGVGFWVTVALVALLLGYSLSWGPACWITSRTGVGVSKLPVVYRPMTWAMSTNEGTRKALDWYAQIGASNGWSWHFLPALRRQRGGTVSIVYRWEWK